MHTELRLQRINPETLLCDYIDRRLYFALSRFGERMGRVTTRINTSAGNSSQEFTCRIAADLRPFGVITTEASDADVYTAIDRCISRLARRCQAKCARPRSVRPSRASIRVPEPNAA